MTKEKLKPCNPGLAYISKAWTKEKKWFKRKYVEYCYKCGRRIIFNNSTRRYRHLKEKRTTSNHGLE